MALWHAPIYGWLLLVSGWARRAPFLWAVLPPLAIGIVEKIAFNTSYFGSLVARPLDRIRHGASTSRTEWCPDGCAFHPAGTTRAGKIPDQPGSVGRAGVAAAFLAAAVRLRRYREPHLIRMHA